MLHFHPSTPSLLQMSAVWTQQQCAKGNRGGQSVEIIVKYTNVEKGHTESLMGDVG